MTAVELIVSRPEVAKKILPDKSDRQTMMNRRLGEEMESARRSEAPTEKKPKQSYELPSLEPMMQTWTYTAIRHEEGKTPVEDLSEEEAESEKSEDYEQTDAENVMDTSEQNALKNY